MTRTRRSAKSAGTAHETAIVRYLAEHVDPAIERRARNGAKDRGDVSGLRAHGLGVVVEAKNFGGQIKAAEWMGEAEIERGNADALAGVVVAKRKGTTDPGSQWVLTTVRELVALITGQRPEEEK